jgi:hypothetical protein
MEVNLSKQLHRHALPVVLVILCLLALAIVSLLPGSKSDSSLAKALFTRTIHIKPKANGLAGVSLGSKVESIETANIQDAGRSTQLTFSLQSN